MTVDTGWVSVIQLVCEMIMSLELNLEVAPNELDFFSQAGLIQRWAAVFLDEEAVRRQEMRNKRPRNPGDEPDFYVVQVHVKEVWAFTTSYWWTKGFWCWRWDVQCQHWSALQEAFWCLYLPVAILSFLSHSVAVIWILKKKWKKNVCVLSYTVDGEN